MNSPKMNVEVKAKWLEALRSGKYKQGRLYLKTDDAFCCLGILCDIYGKDGWTPDFDKNNVGIYLGKKHNLPVAVIDWSGLNSPNPHISDNEFPSLAELNDNGGTFETIADIIEKQL